MNYKNYEESCLLPILVIALESQFLLSKAIDVGCVATCRKLVEFNEAIADVVKLFRKAGFNPDQPRVPAGNPDGGQWSDGSWGSSGSFMVVDAETVMTDAIVGNGGARSNSMNLHYPRGNHVIDPNTKKPYPAPSRLDIEKNVEKGKEANLFDMYRWFSHGGEMDYQRLGAGTFNYTL